MKIVICNHCMQPEYWGEMRWLNGFCGCRNCYQLQYENYYHKAYPYSDLKGERPTFEEYERQENDYKLLNGKGK